MSGTPHLGFYRAGRAIVDAAGRLCPVYRVRPCTSKSRFRCVVPPTGCRTKPSWLQPTATPPSRSELSSTRRRTWPGDSYGFARVGPTHPDARASPRSEQGIDKGKRENHQAGSCQTAKDDCGKPGVTVLPRSKRGTRFRTASHLGGTRQRRGRFCSPWVERDQRKGMLSAAARRRIETGSLFRDRYQEMAWRTRKSRSSRANR